MCLSKGKVIKMSNSLFNALSNNRNQSGTSMQQQLNNLRSNPAQVLKQRGFNIPSNVDLKNPGQIINYLTQSGQINNPRLQMVQRMAQQLMGR